MNGRTDSHGWLVVTVLYGAGMRGHEQRASLQVLGRSRQIKNQKERQGTNGLPNSYNTWKLKNRNNE